MPDDPNMKQVGGDHYAAGGNLQSWDVVEDYGLGYLEGCVIKYITRWRRKNGVEDLRKADHYVRKLAEKYDTKGRRPRGEVPGEVMNDYVVAYDLRDDECWVLFIMCDVWSRADLNRASEILQGMIAREEKR